MANNKKTTSSNKKSSSNKSSSSKTIKQVSKVIKKSAKKNPKGTAVGLVFVAVIAVGVVGGYMVYKYLNPDYSLVLNGRDTQCVALDGTYVEKGAVAKYGKEDVSNLITTTYTLDNVTVNDINTTVEATYYAKYEISYKKMELSLTRKIIVSDVAPMSINFLELGNHNTGDCTYIKAGDVDILIDAGSRQNSSDAIRNFLNKPGNVDDGKLEYVIVTHAHQDHIEGFTDTNEREGIFKSYKVDNIIEFAQTSKTDGALYKKYVLARNYAIEQGAIWHTAADYFDAEKGLDPIITFEDAPGITMEVLKHKYYTTLDKNDENNHSVCVLFEQGDNHYLFTGDLEASGEKSLVESNPNLPKVELFKGAHHGSYTANTDTLLDVIQPKNVCICCCAGNDEYTAKLENQFPAQASIDRMAKWTKNIYVTTVSTDGHNGFESLNGDITFYSEKGGIYTITGSNNSTVLKDTLWFNTNRVWNGKENYDY